MPGQTVSAGPFVGGLNALSDPGAIGDQELAVCQNFEVDPDGALRTRPPFVDRSITLTLASTGDLHILGTYYDTAGIHVVATDGNSSTYVFNGTSWSLVTNTFAATAAVQFNSVLYLLAPVGTPNGGTWNGTTFTADSTMPKGTAMVAYKSRLWVATAGSTVRYSGVIVDGTFWNQSPVTGGSFVVNGQDGEAIIALIVAFGSLLAFRTRSIWQFTYSTDPAFGAQQALVGDVGLSNSSSIEMFENIIYFMYDGKAYVLNGANASQLNVTVPFTATSRIGIYLPYAVSIVNRRVVYTYYDTQYVWNLRSRTWTTWRSVAFGGIGKMEQLSGADTGDTPVYITHSNVTVPVGGTRRAKTVFFTDGYTTEVEPGGFDATMRTKIFDYATPDKYKRLFWWGVDAIFRSSMTAVVVPVIYATQVTWGQLRTRTWGQLLDYTWGQSAIGSFDATTTIPAAQAGSGPVRKFVKFPKSLRFRRVYYQITITVDGAITTSPSKLFSVETIVDVKQLVSKQVS